MTNVHLLFMIMSCFLELFGEIRTREFFKDIKQLVFRPRPLVIVLKTSLVRVFFEIALETVLLLVLNYTGFLGRTLVSLLFVINTE